MRWRLAGCVILACMVSSVSGEESGTRPPNIVLIMADDLGAECLACYGSLEDETPHLDALAGQGTRFTHAFSQPLCTPTRVQIMTGKYNSRNYVEFGYLNPDETTFADVLREAGYATAIAGKWQLSGSGEEYPEHTDPTDWGFDEHCLWQLNNRKPFGDIGSRYWDPYLERNGKVLQPGPEAYGPNVCTEFLLDFMTRNQERPFLAYYPMILTHSPYEPTPESPPGAEKRTKKSVKNFRDMVTAMDKNVGRIVSHVKSLGLEEETVIIFTGDNGTGRGVSTRTKNGVIHGDKGATTAAGMHVPLIVSWPGHVEAGVETDRLVDFTDVFPSLLNVAGVTNRDALSLDGIAFLNASGVSDEQRDAIYSWYEPRHGPNSARRNAIFAQDHRYKLYADGRMFDVVATPLEQKEDVLTNLDTDAVHAKEKLEAVLARYHEME